MRRVALLLVAFAAVLVVPASAPAAKFVFPKVSADMRGKPAVGKARSPVPSGLRTQDVVKGRGAVARAGDTVEVQYVGAFYKTGKQFDASWDNGQTFTFPLGAGQVIPGFDQGVAGMRVGGRRTIVIPARLGYGPQGAPGIPSNSNLTFVVDLVAIR